MKKLSLLFALFILAHGAFAQALTVTNNSACDYDFIVEAHNPLDMGCSMYSNTFTVANSGGTVTFTDPTVINSPGGIGWMIGGPAIAGAIWDLARVDETGTSGTCHSAVGVGCGYGITTTTSPCCGGPTITWTQDKKGNVSILVQ